MNKLFCQLLLGVFCLSSSVFASDPAPAPAPNPYSGTYECEALTGDGPKPSFTLDADSGALAIQIDEQTSFSGIAAKIVLGKVSALEYYLSLWAGSTAKVAFNRKDGTSGARLWIDLSPGSFICSHQ